MPSSRLADRGFPHFHLDGQTAMIDDYLAVRPEREPELRRHVRAGRLSAGPWVTQMDAFLVSGESHIRNLEMGLARARELGRALEVGYLPDQFGHIGQMPQILRSAGIEHAVVWRGVPRTVDRDVFRWEGPDGSEVLAEYLAFGYFNGEAYRRAEDPRELARRIEETLGRQRPFRTSDRILVMVGSDHAGPDPSLPQRVAAAASHLEGVEVRIGGLEDHLGGRRLRGPVPTHRGELRSSARANLLTGVASARANQKRERARVEALLERAAEPLAALVPGFPWPEERLREAWTLLLWNGAHDSACGCSHDRVARDVAARFAAARAIAEALVDEALTTLGARVAAAGTIRFNPSPFERDGVPGLGWRVVAGGAEPAELPLSVGIEDGWVRAAGLAFALRDEPDQGDLYTFCPGGEARPPERLETDGRTVLATWPGLEVRLRLRRLRGEPFLRLEGSVRNERPDHRLRLHLRLPERAGGSLAGSPFELVRRPPLGEGGVEPAVPALAGTRGGGRGRSRRARRGRGRVRGHRRRTRDHAPPLRRHDQPRAPRDEAVRRRTGRPRPRGADARHVAAGARGDAGRLAVGAARGLGALRPAPPRGAGHRRRPPPRRGDPARAGGRGLPLRRAARRRGARGAGVEPARPSGAGARRGARARARAGAHPERRARPSPRASCLSARSTPTAGVSMGRAVRSRRATARAPRGGPS
ncbi:MAG: hypothetical protein KatS3mg014_0251 [Actinomycetota bacterium]|nr:MAG: hypothetical protein KatS3mg014_0251 [Actinomycetota bacterium]